jgi:transcriptional regulator of acetoin/glycerol metabolism
VTTPTSTSTSTSTPTSTPWRLADVERAHVLHVLERCGGSQQDAARLLGIGRTTLWRKLKSWGIAEA